MATAFIFAAGRGERLRPLTDSIPKPLLSLGPETLLDRHLRRLSQAGFRHIVMNISHLADKIRDYCGNGDQWDLRIDYSREKPPALETGGGLVHALHLIKDDTFLVINGDIWTDADYAQLMQITPDARAHLWLTENPDHNAQGDFALDGNTRIQNQGTRMLTFTGIAVYRKDALKNLPAGRFSITPHLREWAKDQQITGALLSGRWLDVGTQERLETARRWSAQKHGADHA